MLTVCIASGASLTQEDVDLCKGQRVYVVNDCYKLAPWADLLYAADTQWWEHHKGVEGFKGEKWTVSHEAEKKYGINRIDYKSNLVWGDGEILATGGNSGFQVLNLAVMRGATKVILLGYDMGGKHWFGDHPPHMRKNSPYGDWIKNFNKAAPLISVPVINCTRNTALECFPRMELQDVLKDK